MSVGTNIKKYLKSKGISQIFICNKTKISPPLLSMSLNGKRKLSLEEYANICYVLGVDTNYFLKQRKPDKTKND